MYCQVLNMARLKSALTTLLSSVQYAHVVDSSAGLCLHRFTCIIFISIAVYESKSRPVMYWCIFVTTASKTGHLEIGRNTSRKIWSVKRCALTHTRTLRRKKFQGNNRIPAATAHSAKVCTEWNEINPRECKKKVHIFYINFYKNCMASNQLLTYPVKQSRVILSVISVRSLH